MIPIVGIVTLVLGPLALVFGVIGLIVKNKPLLLAITGSILGITGVVVANIVSDTVTDSLREVTDFLQLKPDTVEMGELAENSSYKIVVMDVEDDVSAVSGLSDSSTPEGKYVVVSIAAKNSGDTTQKFWNNGQKLVDTDGNEHVPSGGAARTLEYSNDLLSDTDSGEVVAGNLVYDIPENTRPEYLRSDEMRIVDSVRIELE